MAKALPFVVIGVGEVEGYVQWYVSSLPSVSFIDMLSDDAEVMLHPNFLLKSVSFCFTMSSKDNGRAIEPFWGTWLPADELA